MLPSVRIASCRNRSGFLGLGAKRLCHFQKDAEVEINPGQMRRATKQGGTALEPYFTMILFNENWNCLTCLVCAGVFLPRTHLGLFWAHLWIILVSPPENATPFFFDCHAHRLPAWQKTIMSLVLCRKLRCVECEDRLPVYMALNSCIWLGLVRLWY